MQFESLGSLIAMEHIANTDRPDLPTDPGQGHILKVEPEIEKERQPRSEHVDIHAFVLEIIDVGKAVRQSISRLPERRRSSKRLILCRTALPTSIISRTKAWISTCSDRGCRSFSISGSTLSMWPWPGSVGRSGRSVFAMCSMAMSEPRDSNCIRKPVEDHWWRRTGETI